MVRQNHQLKNRTIRGADRLRYEPITIKTAIRKSNLSDHFVAQRYKFSPYRGCEHGCSYCDGRAEKYFVAGDFAKDIQIRKNILPLLEKELPKIREKGFIGIGSGVTDAYQPIEKKEKLSRGCAQLIRESGRPASLLTKSSLVLRDIDIWSEVNKNSRFILMMSIHSTNPKVIKKFEPGASPLEERIETLREFKKAGCATGILAMPFLPGISDNEKNISELYDLASELKVDFLIPGNLTLRPGKQKDFFYQAINPDLHPLYNEIYREDRQSGNTTLGYRDHFFPMWSRIRRPYNIPGFIPHHLYHDQLDRYDEINILLEHMAYFYQEKGKNISRLKKATKRYQDWILSHKKFFNRRRSLDSDYLDNLLLETLKNGEMSDILKNEKLANFIKSVALDGKLFDYNTLLLEE